MKGYKGFSKGLVCKNKQYAENTVFKEPEAVICKKGMHFCPNPFDVLEHYGFVGDNAELNEFCEVEALAEPTTDYDKTFCTTELKIGAKIGIAGLVNAFVEFTLSKIKKSKKATNTGDRSAATNTGDRSAATNTGDRSAATNTGYRSAATNTGYQSAATNTGDQSAATNTGYQSAATVSGKESIAIATGIEGKVKGALGCYIAAAEWRQNEQGEYHLVDFQSRKVDGISIKPDTFYVLKDGEFQQATE